VFSKVKHSAKRHGGKDQPHPTKALVDIDQWERSIVTNARSDGNMNGVSLSWVERDKPPASDGFTENNM